MIIHDLERTELAEGCQRISAIATFETPKPRSFRVYFEWSPLPHKIATTADAFLVGFLAPAMLLGEDLEIRGPVDSELLGRIREDVMPLLLRWFRSLHPIEVVCRDTEPAQPGGSPRATAMSWSGGLDATYTATKHLDRIDWLVTCQGFDVRTWHTAFWKKLLGEIENSAEALGKPLIVVKTNLREVSHFQSIQTRRGRIDPDYYRLGHLGPIGNFMVSLGRCLTPFVSEFITAANVSYEELYPYGSHPLLDPMWSTAAQKVIHDGCEAGRIDKVAFLKKANPEAIKRLRVCWYPGPREVNCGRCEKCMRTMAELRCAEAEHLGASFSGSIDFRAIRRLRIDDQHWYLWREIRRFAELREDRKLAQAAAAITRRPRRFVLFESERRREKRLARDFWKHTRKMMKPPKEATGEVPTPEALLKELDRKRSGREARQPAMVPGR